MDGRCDNLDDDDDDDDDDGQKDVKTCAPTGQCSVHGVRTMGDGVHVGLDVMRYGYKCTRAARRGCARDDEDKDEDEDCAGAWMRWCVSLNRA